MTGRVYKFAEFELSLADGELRTASSCVRLQDKPLLLLSALLDQPQTLVTREQLRQRMWGSDTFVNYEQGINVAIKKVRGALSDSAENPRFIQTVAKKGYRFLVPVEVRDYCLAAPATVTPSGGWNPSEQAKVPPFARGVQSRRWLFAALTVTSLLAVGLWLFQERSARAHHPERIHSLAVLPLRNLSPDPGQDYFADGITEDLTTSLAQSLPLRVISRTSVIRYKEVSEPITQIARELGVEALVEGAVARSGDRVAITVQLIDAREDRHLWAQKYDRRVGDLLSMEEEVSREVASQVGATLRGHQIEPAVLGPVDPQVYELCLLGLYHWNKRTAADLAKSADYYQQAIARDANYAPAYAGLASTYAVMPSYDRVAVSETYAKARAAARRAIELDDTLPQAHATLGLISLNTPSWEEGGAELKRSLQLNPNYATAHHWLAYYLLFSGRADEAVAEIETARELDPLSAIINADAGAMLYRAKRYEEAGTRLRRALELAPDFGQPHETAALIDLETGKIPEAVKQARTGLALAGTNPRTLGEAGYVLAATGHTDEARRLLAALKRTAPEYPVFAALIAVGLGQPEKAIDALEAHSKFVGLQGLSQWHAFDRLVVSPRYQKLVARTKDVVVAQRSEAPRYKSEN